MKPFQIGNRWVGPGHPCYIIAELSANHNQSLDRAMELVKAAHSAGADAVKLQTYTADTLTLNSNSELFRMNPGSIWAGKTLYQLYSEAFMPWEWQPRLKAFAEYLGMQCFSSPFDETAVDFLETLNVPVYKIASFELIDLPLLKKIAQTGKPVIASVGMASLGEIEEAAHVLRNNGCPGLALLKCTSAYPAPLEEMNLRTIPHLSATFDAISGLSDHTLSTSLSAAAVALGASIIEKHFTIKRSDEGPDAQFSLEPHEFKEVVQTVRDVEKALGKVTYERTSSEKKNLQFRRSLFAVKDISVGESFTKDNVRSIRPGYGLPPRYMDIVLSSIALRDILKGEPLKLSDLCIK